MADVEDVLPEIKPGWVGAEVGCLRGESSFALLSHGIDHLYCIDSWTGPYLEDYVKFTDRVSVFPKERLTVLQMKSIEAVCVLPKLDFVFLDALHDYESAMQDIRLYWGLIQPGGLMCGHDYFNAPPTYEVKRAADEFFSALGLPICQAGPRNNPGASLVPSWYVHRPEK